MSVFFKGIDPGRSSIEQERSSKPIPWRPRLLFGCFCL